MHLVTHLLGGVFESAIEGGGEMRVFDAFVNMPEQQQYA